MCKNGAMCGGDGGGRMRRFFRRGQSVQAGIPLLCEERAQSTLEYAIALAALLALASGLAAIWRAAERGSFAGLVERAASHALEGWGPLDIPLY